MNDVDLKLVVFSSFLGAVRDGVRAIAYDYSGDLISIYGYMNRQPDEDDYDAIDIAVTEIMASCPQFSRQKIEFVKTDDPVGKLNSYKGWVFVRYEN